MLVAKNHLIILWTGKPYLITWSVCIYVPSFMWPKGNKWPIDIVNKVKLTNGLDKGGIRDSS